MPVYVVAFVSTIFFGHMSDRFQLRGPILVGLAVVALVGYIILLAVRTVIVARYVALCIIALGIYPCIPIVLTWTNVNIIGFTRRATAAAGINMIAQLFGVIANLLFTTPPYYVGGISFVIAAIFVCIVSSLICIFMLRAKNKRKRAAQDSPEAASQRDRSYEDLGNAHPDFFYTI